MSDAAIVALYRSRAENTATLLNVILGEGAVKAFAIFLAMPESVKLVEEYGIPPHDNLELSADTDLRQWLREQHADEDVPVENLPLEYEGHIEGYLCIALHAGRTLADVRTEALDAFRASEAERLAVMRRGIDLAAEMENVREMFRALFDPLPHPSVVVDRQTGHIQHANPAFEALASLSPPEIIGKSLWRLGAFSSEWSFQQAIEASAREKRPVLIRTAARFRVPTILSIKASFINTSTVCVVFSDFGEQVTLRNRLLEAEKRGAIFNLFRRIIHDLNNPLTAIRGFAQLMSTRPQAVDEVKRDAFLIMTQARRCNDILAQVRRMARTTQRLNTRFDLNELVLSAVGLHRIEAESRGVEIATDLAHDLPAIIGNYFSILSALDEAVVNALETFEDAGKTGTISIATKLDGDHAALLVEDEAGGATQPEKVFEPFYTTRKAPGHAGLGLTMIRAVAQEIGATVVFRNTEKGVSLCLTLPIKAE